MKYIILERELPCEALKDVELEWSIYQIEESSDTTPNLTVYSEKNIEAALTECNDAYGEVFEFKSHPITISVDF